MHGMTMSGELASYVPRMISSVCLCTMYTEQAPADLMVRQIGMNKVRVSWIPPTPPPPPPPPPPLLVGDT